MDDPAEYHITQTTVRRAAEIEEATRKAVLALALPEVPTGLTRAVSQGVLQGWVQIASLDHERHEMAEGLRRMADAIEASANA